MSAIFLTTLGIMSVDRVTYEAAPVRSTPVPTTTPAAKIEVIKVEEPVIKQAKRASTPAEVRAYLVEEFASMPVMVEVCRCESRFRQFKSPGVVLRGEQNPKDVGVCQINEKYHLEASQKLGMDIYTLEGNVEYAKYLYGKQGTQPWNWSRECWGGLSVEESTL